MTGRYCLPAALVIVCAAGLAARGAGARGLVPDAAAQKQAEQLIRQVYGKEIDEAETSAEKADLAGKMLREAGKARGDPSSHFVLLRK